ncbi:MAG TPA: hypothetical protein VMT85_06070 [Thermoanaerobaculia bacterium]|nr:hypothetical protein [Thermoanaerobaculia bacterium]
MLGSSGIERSRDLAVALVRAAGGELELPRRAAEQSAPEHEAPAPEAPELPASPTHQRSEIHRALDPQTVLESEGTR